jgi:hypothetical protein
MKKLIVGFVVVLLGVGAFFVLRPASIVVVSDDSNLSPEKKKQLLERYGHSVSYPSEATDVCFHLEPKNFDTTDIHGEYVSFNAPSNVISSFVTSTLGAGSEVATPSDYSQWHFGIGDYSWWHPNLVDEENSAYFEKGDKMITVDWSTGTAFYSCVLRGSVR